MMANFLTCIREIPEHRIAGMVIYPLDEMLLTTLVRVVSGAEDFDEVESMGGELVGWLNGLCDSQNAAHWARRRRSMVRHRLWWPWPQYHSNGWRHSRCGHFQR